MHTLHCNLDVMSPLVMTAASATEGGHESLGHVPGAALLGAAAADGGYAAAGDLAWDLFHSGRVSFGDAQPVDIDGAQGIPLPSCIEVPKGSRPDSLAGAEWVNVLRAGHRPAADERPRVVLAKGGGVIFPSGRLNRARKQYTLKTAIDPATGRAKEGALFGYEAIVAGTRLGFSIVIDLDEAHTERVLRFLEEQLIGPVALGRSRGAEFGSAQIEAQPEPPPGLLLREPVVDGDVVQLSLLLISAAAWTTADGEPAALPRPEMLGLPDGTVLVLERCSLNHRRWTPFNGHRKQPDSERVVAEAGGVVTFDVPRASFDPALLTRLRDLGELGVSAHRAEGLGRFLVQPAMLCVKRAEAGIFREEPRAPDKPVGSSKPPAGRLGRWLDQRQKDAKEDQGAYDAARAAFSESFQPLAKRPKSPSVSQWQAVRAEARKAIVLDGTHIEDLLAALVGEGVAKQAWGDPKKDHTPAGMLLQEIDRCSQDGASDRFKALLTQHLAQFMARERQAVTREGKGQRNA